MASALYGPMMVELFHSTAVPGELETTYLGDSFINGAPGSCSAVRVDHAGANISNVRRPRRIALHEPIAVPMAAPILGSKPYPNVQDGSSKTPSRAMNSCTLIVPTVISSISVPRALSITKGDRALGANSSIRPLACPSACALPTGRAGCSREGPARPRSGVTVIDVVPPGSCGTKSKE